MGGKHGERGMVDGVVGQKKLEGGKGKTQSQI